MGLCGPCRECTGVMGSLRWCWSGLSFAGKAVRAFARMPTSQNRDMGHPAQNLKMEIWAAGNEMFGFPSYANDSLISEIRKSSLNQTQNDGKNHRGRYPEHQ